MATTLYYDEEGGCVHLQNEVGKVLTIRLAGHDDVLGDTFEFEGGLRLPSIDRVSFRELGDIIDFWSDFLGCVRIRVFLDMDCFLGGGDFSGMKSIRIGSFKVDFIRGGGYAYEEVDLLDTSDEYFLVLYEYSKYRCWGYRRDHLPFGGRYAPEAAMCRQFQSEIAYYSFIEKPKYYVIPDDPRVADRMRALGKYDELIIFHL